MKPTLMTSEVSLLPLPPLLLLLLSAQQSLFLWLASLTRKNLLI